MQIEFPSLKGKGEGSETTDLLSVEPLESFRFSLVFVAGIIVFAVSLCSPQSVLLLCYLPQRLLKKKMSISATYFSPFNN